MFCGPFFHPEFLNHAEVVDFQGMRYTFGAVGHRLKSFAGKFSTFETEIHLLILNAGVHFAMPVDPQNFQTRAISVVWSAPLTLKLVFGNVVPFEKGFPVFPVLFCYTKRTVETIFSAWRCK
jgi:hypothetical protein